MTMSRKQAAALIAANAAACETATERRCVCACGGALHGVRHGLDWMREQVNRLSARDDGQAPPELPDLFPRTVVELRSRAMYFRTRFTDDPAAPNWYFTRALELDSQADNLEDAQNRMQQALREGLAPTP